VGSCSTDNSGEIETGPKTIYEILASEVNYTTLTNALEITGKAFKKYNYIDFSFNCGFVLN